MSYIGNNTQNINYVPAIDYFNGDGSTVAFTLSRPVASVAAVQAVISNVPQNPGSAFTVLNNTITFTSAPPSGTSNIYVYYTSPNTQIIQTGQGTVGNNELKSDLTFVNPSYTGTFTGGTGVINIGSGQFYKDASGNVGIGTGSPSKQLEVNKTGKFGLGNTIGTAAIQFTHSDASALVWQLNSGISGVTHTAMSIGTVASPNMVNIDSSGNLLVGTTSVLSNAKYSVYVANGSGSTAITTKADNNTYYPAIFLNSSGTVCGYINCTTSTTNYSTSSDYRLKENIQPMQNALGVVAQLNPVTYTWKADGSDGQGFIAHELQAVVPDCVTGEKDAVDAEGKPVYQGIDTSFLVATLTAAIQELSAKNDALEARVKELEAR